MRRHHDLAGRRVGWAISWTATVGRLPLILVHDAPRLTEAQMPNSVPQYSTLGLVMSSRRTRVEPKAGRLLTIGFQVWPKSSVTYR